MKTELYLQIPKPCHENWDAMTPVDKGKFCSSCSKEVVDFSLLTDVEVLNFFKRSTGNTCGRFSNDQLGRPFQETKIEKKKSWKWAMASITSLIMISRTNAQKKENYRDLMGDVITRPKNIAILKGDTVLKEAPAPGFINTKLVMPKIQNDQIIRLGGVCAAFNIKLKGYVVDEKNDPIEGAEVQADNTIFPVFTNAKGYFEVMAQTRETKFSVTVKSDGFDDERSIIDLTKGDAKIIMKTKAHELPGVTVVGYGTHTEINQTGGIFAYTNPPKKDSTYMDTVISHIRNMLGTSVATRIDTVISHIWNILGTDVFKIYPNPAARNSVINISIKEAGSYQILLFDNAGRLLHVEESITTGKQQVINFQLPGNVVSGYYYIRLINMQTKKAFTSKIIVQ